MVDKCTRESITNYGHINSTRRLHQHILQVKNQKKGKRKKRLSLYTQQFWISQTYKNNFKITKKIKELYNFMKTF